MLFIRNLLLIYKVINMEETKNGGLLNNLFWKFAERISAQVITLIVSIILARLLEPTHYGTIAIVNIFIALANVFVVNGFGSALIQKKNADAVDYSSVLYFNIGFSVFLYLVLFICAPHIARFYGNGYEILSPVLRVLGLRIIVAGVNSVQQAYVSKKMIFKKFFYSTLCGTIVSGAIGIAMAYLGCGVWSLVAQYLVGTTVNTLVLAFSLKRKPIIAFSFKRLKTLLEFGSKMLGSGLLIAGYEELKALIIGKLYSPVDLAYYDKGKQFPSLIVTNINTSIGAVLFPKMANQQDDIKQIKATARNSIRFSSYIMCPIMLGFMAISESFVSLVLSDKWLPCVPLLRFFCIIYLFQPIHTANMQAIKAIGRSDVYLKLEIIKKSIELIVLLCVMSISVDAIVVSTAIYTTFFTFINAFPNRKLIDYSFREQVRDILPALVGASNMAIVVYLMGFLPFKSTFVLMCIQIICGSIIYICLSIITRSREFYYIFNLVRSKIKK